MATVKAVIIQPDGTVKDAVIVDDFMAFQAIVGGYIEAVIGLEATMYVNEEGLLKSLPFNPVATEFAHQVLRRPVTLYGTALIVGPPTGEGDDTDVRPSVVGYFNKEN